MWRVACLLGLASSVYSQLTLTGVKCGQLTCALGEYCSPETSRCASCADVCNSSHHNYDSGFCVKECQGKDCITLICKGFLFSNTLVLAFEKFVLIKKKLLSLKIP